MKPAISGTTIVAGVVGAPVAHSLSPLIHNAWLEAAGLDGVYVAVSPAEDRFAGLIEALRYGVFRGLNVTAPFKQTALAAADRSSVRARRAGSANLLVFHADGSIEADNTDGEGVLAAFAAQAPNFLAAAGPMVILGAGGAARGAAAAFLEAGAPEVRIVNRTFARAAALCELLGAKARPFALVDAPGALATGSAVVNATVLGLGGGEGPEAGLLDLQPSAVVMDMNYRPLRTRFLQRAAALGHVTVDGLAMLIGQAAPSFQALFGQPPPAIDVRGLAIRAMEDRR